MKSIFRIMEIILAIIFTALLQVAVREFLPYPFNQINIIFAIIIWLIIFTNQINVLWVLLPVSFLVEIFSPALFGVFSAAAFLSLSLVSWFLLNIFVDRSVYIVLLSGILGVLGFRLLKVLLSGILLKYNFLSSTEILIDWLWEIALTAATLAVFYFFTSLFTKRLHPEYIRLNK